MSPERHQRLMSILADAMECETLAREDLLAKSCREDVSLRLEVEHLLRHQTPAQDFMEEPLVNGAPCDHSDEEESVIGRHIGPYLIIDEIGRGGMGAVYLAARDDGQYDQQVALKLIKRGMDSEEVLRRFRRERQILANLAHANISRLLDGGMTTDGRPYFVMEYVAGLRIDEYANGQRLSTAERLEVFLAVCVAVQYAHRHNTIHRDIKPGNILITADGTPKLVDFGIAKLLDSEHQAQSTAETATALRLLTPEYASPEQLRGLPLSAASDVYSLGVVLYELLTGHRPYGLKSRAPQEILQSVMKTDPQKPSTAISGLEESSSSGEAPNGRSTPEVISRSRNEQLSKLRRELRGDLDNIVLMALRKEPERRYPSVEKFAEDIRHHLDGLPITARKDTFVYRSSKFLERNKPAVISALLVALLLGVSLAIFTGRNKTRESIAVLPFINSNQDPNLEYLGDGITDRLIDYLSALPNFVVPAHNSVFRFKGQDADPKKIGDQLGVGTLLTGNVESRGDQLFINVQLIDTRNDGTIWRKQYSGRSLDILTMQQEIARDVGYQLGAKPSVRAVSRPQDPRAENAEAYRLYLKGNYFWNQRTPESLKIGIDYFQQAIEREPNYALAYVGLANCYNLLGAYQALPASEAFPKARDAATKALELDSNLAETHTSIAIIRWLYDWDWAGADREFRRAIELNPHYVTAHHWYGLYLAEMGRFLEAEAELRRALELDPISLPVNADLARVYFYARRYEKSLEQYRKATEMDPNYSAFYEEIAYLYEQLGLPDEMITAREKHWDIIRGLREAYKLRGIKGYWRKTLEGLERQPERPGRDYNKAEIYARLGDKERAFQSLERAYQARDHMMIQLYVNPVLDNLRSDPRFAELLRRMNLTPYLPNSSSAVASGIH